MIRESNPEFEILGMSAVKFTTNDPHQVSMKNLQTLENAQEYPQPDKSFNQSYVGGQSRKSIVNSSYNHGHDEGVSSDVDNNYVKSFNMIDINQSADFNENDAFTSGSQAWKQSSMFGQKYPFSTRNKIHNISRISKKNLFNPCTTISLDQSFKQRDDMIQKIKEENKKNTPNLIDPAPVRRNAGKIPKLQTQKPHHNSRAVLSRYLHSMSSAEYFPKEKSLRMDCDLSPQNKLPQIKAVLNQGPKKVPNRAQSNKTNKSIWSCYRESPGSPGGAFSTEAYDKEAVGSNNLYFLKKKAINDRSGANIYLKEGEGIPTKIKKATMPLIKSLEAAKEDSKVKKPDEASVPRKKKPAPKILGIKRYSKAELKQKRKKAAKKRCQTINRLQVPKFDEADIERKHNNGYKIDFEHWYRVMGLTDSKISLKEKRKREFLKFLSGLNEIETQLYWQEKAKEIEKTYSFQNMEKIANEKWRKVKPTWRNTGVADKVLFFAMVDQEQQNSK
ncbi:unnamed protein product [Moneuplotes crassus]|uniref:Uncharacterized protein n=2 Tax=Euplotes crassus TaxID=5936 RepID=A0AAD1X671_EUPCR|nr:unnamed protein product [Moneuplotes crassus]